MNYSDFNIGLEFATATGQWRCTDIGTRTIIAINISDKTVLTVDDGLTRNQKIDASSWLNGPPYAVVEHVFDENDLGGCTFSLEDL